MVHGKENTWEKSERKYGDLQHGGVDEEPSQVHVDGGTPLSKHTFGQSGVQHVMETRRIGHHLFCDSADGTIRAI